MPDTHVVTNQVPPLENYNPATSPVLNEALIREGGEWGLDEVTELGALSGTAQAQRWGELADRNQPILRTHDRYGHRIDEVEYGPAYHELMKVAIGHGLHAAPWADERPGSHVVRAAKTSVWTPEPGHICPISMTYAVVPALRNNPELSAVYEPLLTSREYDPELKVPATKAGITAGMSMTEKQGGSDVRAGTTQAAPNTDGSYVLTGHKWFTSAPMCDVFLVLAQAPDGLSCFLLPRFTPDGERNHGFRLQRLKDKLGNRSNASAELELDRAAAWLVGEEGRGIRTIIEMVNHTRLDCVVGSVGLMRQAVAQAGWHAAHRQAFGARLADKPLMQNVLADLEIEVEAATHMMLRLSGAFDRAAADPREAAFRRIATPVAKYWVTKRCSEVVREALECLGGNGYVEESIMPRLYRESPLNAIWEGSGNVIALDALRAITGEPEAVEVFLEELRPDVDPSLSSRIGGLRDELAAGPGQPEAGARRLVEQLARVWAASLLVEGDHPPVADAYLASRIAGDHGALFGTLPSGLPLAAISARSIPTL